MNVFAKNKSIRQIHRAIPEDYFHIARIYNSYISKGSTTLESRLFSVSDMANWYKETGEREGLFVIKQDFYKLIKLKLISVLYHRIVYKYYEIHWFFITALSINIIKLETLYIS